MHLDISQEPLFAEIYRKNARAQLEHPDQAPAFTLTVRKPQCGNHLFGWILPGSAAILACFALFFSYSHALRHGKTCSLSKPKLHLKGVQTAHMKDVFPVL
jgi:hypothetical protein